MDRKELEIIKELMDKLSDEMEYGEEDFAERLGRKKPEVEVVKIEGEIPLDESELELESEDFPEMEMEDEDMLEEPSPEEELKRRLLKLRK